MKRELKKELEKNLNCQTSYDELVLNYYSVDASSYKIKPDLVVFPNNENEIIQIVKFAKKNNLTIVPRGAGTGLVGSALGNQIIIDFKNMDKIKIGKESITAQPGVIKGILDSKLVFEKKFFAPNPSVGKYCTVGGMIGTNASGSHALKYGSVIDNLLELCIIDGSGKKICLPKDKKIGKEILKITKQAVLKKFPKVTKNSCGYRLDSVKNLKQTHRIIAGSEGTLGLVTSAKFRIRDNPQKKMLIIIAYDSNKKIQDDLKKIMNQTPSAVEYVDKHTIRNIEVKFPKNTKSALFVEFDCKPEEKYSKLRKNIKGEIFLKILKNEEIQKWWNYRNSSLAYSLRTIAKNKLAPHIIEDAAIPIEKLEKIFLIIKKINKKYESKTIVYGHAGNGNLHIRLIMEKRTKSHLKKITKEFFDEILSAGGTITAEHGDGLARSEFVKLQYGEKNYKLFKNLKKLLDPQSVLNPNKIITNESIMIKNLEY